MDSSEDPFGAELGAFDLVADSTAAVARQQRIDRARQAARTYQAKVEEPRVRTVGQYSALRARTDPPRLLSSGSPARSTTLSRTRKTMRASRSLRCTTSTTSDAISRSSTQGAR